MKNSLNIRRNALGTQKKAKRLLMAMFVVLGAAGLTSAMILINHNTNCMGTDVTFSVAILDGDEEGPTDPTNPGSGTSNRPTDAGSNGTEVKVPNTGMSTKQEATIKTTAAAVVLAITVFVGCLTCAKIKHNAKRVSFKKK